MNIRRLSALLRSSRSLGFRRRGLFTPVVLFCVLLLVPLDRAKGQPETLDPYGKGQKPLLRAQQPNSTGGAQNKLPNGSQGGAAQADFDSLIDLIESTVAPESWAENGTGEGQIAPFAINGVFVDPTGTLRYSERHLEIASLRRPPEAPPLRSMANARHPSPLRYVSLPRLEAAIRLRQENHQTLNPEMLTLAGLQRVQYVIAYPETGDLVIAGPADNWQVRRDGSIVGVETGSPVVRLDDLLTLWRRRESYGTANFGCSITPRQKSLARIQDYLRANSSQPLEPDQRADWLQGLRDSLGEQEVEFFGIAADTHVSRVLLVADYHMKLIGMGIADGVEGVASYLESVDLKPDGSTQPMSVLRWWFAMNYLPIETNLERNVFRLRGQGVQVLSENELLAERGRRVPTGQSEEINQRFASSFTSAFETICQRYPLYAELRNVFDLAIVVAIIEREGLTGRVDWQPTLFREPRYLRLPSVTVPQEVDTVINHRVFNGRHIVAGVSGGVWLDLGKSMEFSVSGSAPELPVANRKPALPDQQATELWWWD